MTRLKQEREQRGWSQAQVAERIGTTRVNVTRWEQGLYHPSPFFRQKLAALFGKSITELGLLPSHDEATDEGGTLSLDHEHTWIVESDDEMARQERCLHCRRVRITFRFDFREVDIEATLHALKETARIQHRLLEELFADHARAAVDRAPLARSLWEEFCKAHARLVTLLLPRENDYE